jgi:hypothetical protein
MDTPVRHLYSRWQNLVIFSAMLLLVLVGLWFSILLTVGGQVVLRLLGCLVSLGIFGFLSVRALRVGLYLRPPASIVVRSLAVTHTVALEQILGTVVYHSYTGRGGRYYAPGIRVRTDGPGDRVIRLWWIASMSEEGGRAWERRVRTFIDDARAMANG